MNIYEKMSAVTDAIKRVPKNLTVGWGKSQYKAVAEADILSAVKEAEAAQKIFSYPHGRKIVESRVVVKGEENKESQFVRIESTYRFVNIEDPTEFVDVIGYGDGCDSLDKAPGKAMTYADKYALMKAYKIETGDELDAKPSDDLSLHDIFAVKQRIEQLMTAKLKNGLSKADMLSALHISADRLDEIMGGFEAIGKLETRLCKL